MNPEPVESNFLDGDSLYFGDHTQGCPPINRNHWPLSLGITVRLASESLAAFPRIPQIRTVGPLGAPFGGGTATGGTVAAVPDFSLTLVQTFSDTNGGPVSFSVDGNITAVPEPGTLAIFGTALGSLAVIRRRKTRT